MRVGVLIGMLLLCGGSIGCARRINAASLQVQLSSEPVTLDPALAEDGVSLRVLGNLMEGLVGFDATGRWVPRLASQVVSLEGGRKWRFILRKATWSDGVPIEAAHFVAGLKRSLRPGTLGKLTEGLLAIRGARALAAQPAAEPGSPLGVAAPDPLTVLIELDRPDPRFVQRLAMSAAYPARPDWPEPGPGKEWSWIGRPTTGPYLVEAHVRDVEYRLRANARYYGGAAPIERVTFKVLTEDAAALNVFEQGGLDILTRIPALDYERLRDKGLLQTDPFLATFYLGFNTRQAPFRDARFRRAVSQAIHRDDLVAALGMGERATRRWVPPELLAPLASAPRASDLAWARAQVEKLPKAQREIRVTSDAGARNLLVLEKVQADLSRELGLRVKIAARDWKSHVRGLQTDPGAMYRFAWLAPYPDASTHLRVFASGSPNNYTGWASARYDAWLDQAESMKDGPARDALLRRAERFLVDEEAVLAPLYHYVQVHAISHRVAGFKVSPFGVIRFDDLRIE